MDAANQHSPGVILISLTPGLEDRNFLLTLFPHPDRLITGITGFLSYQTSALSYQTSALSKSLPSISFLMPPVGPSLMVAGEGSHVLKFEQIMNASGLPTASVGTPLELQQRVAYITILLHCLLLALELHGWSWSSLRRKGDFRKLSGGMLEAAKAGSTHLHVPWTPLLRVVTAPLTLRVLLYFMPLVFPLDIEKFLEYHFIKVGDQTLLLIEELVDLAQKYQIEHSNLLALLNGVKALRAK